VKQMVRDMCTGLFILTVLWIGIVLMPIRIRLFILMQIQILPQVLHIFENMKYSRRLQRTSFSSASQVLKFSIVWTDRILTISGKKYSLALNLVEMDTDPGRQALDADRIRQNDADPTGSTELNCQKFPSKYDSGVGGPRCFFLVLYLHPAFPARQIKII
jgi:hypothetical protein